MRNFDGGLQYVGGTLVPLHNLRRNTFGYLDLEIELGKLGYVDWKSVSYKLAGTFMYKELLSEDDVTMMLSHLTEGCRAF